jgi:mannitol/fructose-specific phosphotransferase system IIA component (Ntr-type)
MKAPNRQDAILELAQAAATVTGLGAPMVFEAVWQRELVMPTALPNGLAIPHARLAGLEKPLVVVGISPEGIDFDAGDGQAAGLILMVLTPLEAVEAQLEILADIASTFQEAEVIHRALRCEGYTQFMALLNIQSHEARKDQNGMARA